MSKRKSFDYQPSPRRQNQEVQMTMGPPDQRAGTALFGLVFLVLGAFIALIGLGVIHMSGARIHCPMFVLTAVGFAFGASGFAVICQGFGVPQKSFVMKILGLVIISSFLTPFAWLSFGDSGLDIITRVIVGGFVSLFGLLFTFAAVVSIVPGLADRLGIQQIDQSGNNSGVQIGSRKQNQ
jgi:hypothetical protein